MLASELRRRILEDHERLRARLLVLEAQAGAVGRTGKSHAGELRNQASELLLRLRDHMHWEDLHLRPFLLVADAWGQERAEALDRDHREQRELLEFALERIQAEGHPTAIVVKTIVDLIALLRADMEDEEARVLDPSVVRDDVVGIDVETG
jgi:Hemerythrin HHE cation binding domain